MSSLADIMSQQLAKKLEQEELAAVAAFEEREALEALREAGVDVDGGAETGEQCDAREAEEAEALRAAAEAEAALGVGGTGHSTTQLDADLALALRLQAEEEAAAAATGDGRHLTGKASLAVSAPRRRQEGRRVYGAGDWEAAEADAAAIAAEDASRRRAIEAAAEAEEEAEEDEAFAATRGTAHKHDGDITGRRNVRQLARDFSAQAGAIEDVRGAGGRGLRLSNRVASDLRRHLAKGTVKGVRASGRADAEGRATRDAVLDETTRLILFRLVTAGAMDGVSGVLRTGKEAAVLHGTGWRGADDGSAWNGVGTEAGSVVAADTASLGATTAPGSVASGPGPTDYEAEEAEEAGGDEEEAPAQAEEANAAATLFGESLADLSSRAGARADDDEDGDVDGDGVSGGGGEGGIAPDASAVAAALASSAARTAAPPPLPEVAVKVFRTTLNEFSNRFDYLSGDRRYRHAKRLRKQNPRKLIRLWSRKEYANLHRIFHAGLPCPRPRLHRHHVLVMDFLGDDGWPAPQLREAGIRRRTTWRRAYEQTASIMHGLHRCARLVHADLSEFNLLWHRRRVWLIDVGQAVEVSHPAAGRFLLNDALVVSRFFARQGVQVAEPAELARLVAEADVPSVFRPRRAQDIPAAAGSEDAGSEPAAVGGDDDAVTAALRELVKSHPWDGKSVPEGMV